MEWDVGLGGGQAAAIALAVISGILLLVFLALWSRRARGSMVRAPAPEPAELGVSLAQLQDELRELLADTTERLDVRMQALRELLAEARATTDELRRLTAAPATSAGPTVEAPPMPTTEIRSDRTVQAVRPESRRIATPPVRSSRGAATASTGIRLERHTHVYSLADAGLDVSEIASRTGMHRGEVELVLRLRRRQTPADRSSASELSCARDSVEEAKV